MMGMISESNGLHKLRQTSQNPTMAAAIHYLQKLGHSVDANEEFLVQLQSLFALLFIHIEILFQQVDYPVIVAGE